MSDPVARTCQLMNDAYGPEALETIDEAFDKACVEVAGNFGDGPGEIERAQHRLAAALLSVANEDSRDVEVLKQAALVRMALNYRAHLTAPTDHRLAS